MAIALKRIEADMFELDCCGYVCPYPQLFTEKAIKKINPGSRLRVVFDNPSSLETILQYCKREGIRVLSQDTSNGKIQLTIQKP